VVLKVLGDLSFRVKGATRPWLGWGLQGFTRTSSTRLVPIKILRIKTERRKKEKCKK